MTQEDLDRAEAEFGKMLAGVAPLTLSARDGGISSGIGSNISLPSGNGFTDFLKGLLEKFGGPLSKRNDSKIDWDQMAEDLEKRYVVT
jgi:hypothetical protein